MQDVTKLLTRLRSIIGIHMELAFVVTVAIAIPILVGLLIFTSDGEAEIFDPYVRAVGPEEVVFDWSEDACEPSDIPDTPARAFRDAQGRVQLIASHHTNRRMIGPDLDDLSRECDPIMSSGFNADPAEHRDRELIHSVYTLDGSTIFALVHNEYQGHHRSTQCPSKTYSKCWYNSITLAVSTNGGDSYTRAPSPYHLVASIPYPYAPDSGPIGVFNPSNIIDRGDGYYYTLVHVEQYQAQSRGTCLMRTANLADPTSWRAWDGEGFNIQFVDPYPRATDRPEDYVCEPVARDGMTWSVTFNTYFGRFLRTLTADRYDSSKGRTVSGVYYSLSDDLIQWAKPQLLLEAGRPSTYQCGDPAPILYPALLDPTSSSRNFETTGKRAYLYFTRFNDTACMLTFDRDLVRIPIEFAVNPQR